MTAPLFSVTISNPMRKFIINHTKDSTYIVEVECEKAFCSSWETLPDECKYKLILDGKPVVYMSWAVYDTEAFALNVAAGDIRKEFERREIKHKEKFDEQEFLKSVANIKRIRMEK